MLRANVQRYLAQIVGLCLVIATVVATLLSSPPSTSAQGSQCLPQCHSLYNGQFDISQGVEPGLIAAPGNADSVPGALAATIDDMGPETWQVEERYLWVPVEDYKRTVIAVENHFDVEVDLIVTGQIVYEQAGFSAPVNKVNLATVSLVPGDRAIFAAAGPASGKLATLPALDAGWSHIGLTFELATPPTDGYMQIQNTRTHWGPYPD